MLCRCKSKAISDRFKKIFFFSMRISIFFYVLCSQIPAALSADITELYEKLKNNYDIDIPGREFEQSVQINTSVRDLL